MANLHGSTQIRITQRKGRCVAIFKWYQYEKTYTAQGLRARITYFQKRNTCVDLEKLALEQLLRESNARSPLPGLISMKERMNNQ